MRSHSTQRYPDQTRRNAPPLVALDRGYLIFAGHPIGGIKRFDGRREPWLIDRRVFEAACSAGLGKAWRKNDIPWSSLLAIVDCLAGDDEVGAESLIDRLEDSIPKHQSREAIASVLKPLLKHADAHPSLATLRQKFNPNHDDRGRFASGSGGGLDFVGLNATAGTPDTPAMWRPATLADKNAFIDKYQEPIEAAERELGICKDCLLGLSALESGWGMHEATTERNNLFGLDDHSGHNIREFPTPQDSITTWTREWGARARGANTPEEFTRKVNFDRKYNSATPDWAAKVVSVIHTVRQAIRSRGNIKN